MKITIPELALVALVGPSGCGKSTFAAKHFLPTEVVSSDRCRGVVSDDENSMEATKDAFELLHYIAAKRLQRGKLTVVDATNVQPESRKPLVALAREFHCIPVAIVLDLPEKLCQERNRNRPDRNFGGHVIRQHKQQLRRSLRGLRREGFRHVYVLESEQDVEDATIVREPLYNNLKHEHGPFDIIGDVHGCCGELRALLERLGYRPDEEGDGWHHPAGRKAVFLGDLVDRGPSIVETLKLVMAMVSTGAALCVPGNHDIKLMRKLQGRDVQVTHGLADSLEQLRGESEEFYRRVTEFLDGLVSHYVLDDGSLVVAHAGMREDMQGRGSGRVRDFALYGETTGETDDFGLPVRYPWAQDYRGKAAVVYGHTPVPEPEWVNRTINIDTGCVYGGVLTALRYPEKELVSVPAAREYAEPSRPFLDVEPGDTLSADARPDDVLDISDVAGKRVISTRLRQRITIQEANSIAALEVMSRFAVNPRWLVYLPPTMAPCETSARPDVLEYPSEAFAYYRHEGISRVVCEQKHMGSRAVIVVCRDEQAARKRFGIADGSAGVCYTRTGRRFFADPALEEGLLERVRDSAEAAGLWNELATDWMCLDCELMPWSAKAQDLLRTQYAPAGAAAQAMLQQAGSLLGACDSGVQGVKEMLERVREREETARLYVEAYRRYCWPAPSLSDYRLAPFHLLATEGKVHTDKDHLWHMTTLARLAGEDDPLLMLTAHLEVNVTDEAEVERGIRWWEELTGSGGEGMVVKPLDFVARGRRGIVQPAVKCRGREYLRIIYGPEYTLPENFERLRARSLGRKSSLALREFALGMEAIERFVRNEPLYRVHECVFGVLALESEPVDPRL